MNPMQRVFPLVLLAAALLAAVAPGQTEKVLKVGVKHTPPYVIRGADGTWSGISMDLWRAIAADLGFQSELREVELKGMLEGLKSGQLDVGVAALTVTSEREESLDFTHPFQTSGLGIAVASDSGSTLSQILSGFPYLTFLKVLGLLIVGLLAAALLIWMFERRANRAQFGGGAKGVGSGFWWAAVTLTTVGYGDKAPATFGGRTVGFIWMFLSLFVVSAFTATIAAILTTSQLESGIGGPEDLHKVRVATVDASTSQSYLREKRIRAVAVRTAEDALGMLLRGEADAVVYDAPILRYLAAKEMPSGAVTVLPYRFRLQHYALGLTENSPIREEVNRKLLKRTTGEAWDRLVDKYLEE
jgi:ABC-type amino acid transport substrate-binding protein